MKQVICRICGRSLVNPYDNFISNMCFRCSIVKLGDSFYADGFEWVVVYKSLYASGHRTRLCLYKIRKHAGEIDIINFFKDETERLAIRNMKALSEEELVMVSEIMQRLNNEIRGII